MSAPLFLLDPDTLAQAGIGASLILGGAEGRHAADVSRLKPGEVVLLADGSGSVAQCTVSAVARGELRAVIDELHVEAAPTPAFTLVQALAKGDRDLLAAEIGTELGIDAVIPWQADRSIVRWRGDRAAKAHRKWQQTLVAATKQARRARVPQLGELADRKAVIQQIRDADLAFVLHESALEPLASVVVPTTAQQVLLIVGPEGGISPDELAAFVSAGARSVRLGSTVLRTSTAGSAAVAVLSAQTRWQ